ncbi:MAG TPA: malto-oligosyltrehalose synthase [Terriglobia bacterium]|nr:malto-oligosyltrehalose synthase [Terriglobia bacterium]
MKLPKDMCSMTIPVATYRIQFSLGFRFVDARDLVPYLRDLGITHLYASPRFKAGKGSSHGYDVADPFRINSELGTEEEFDELVQKLKSYGMGLLLDIVPNHMVASAENPWWMDVLENGPDSEYAGYFDINWHPATTKSAFLQENKVLLPVLGDLYGNVLEKQELNLKFDENGFYVRYYEHRFPLNPHSYPPILEHWLAAARAAANPDSASVEGLSTVLESVNRLPRQLGRGGNASGQERQARKEIKDRLWDLYNHAATLKDCLDETLRYFDGTRGSPKTFEPLDLLLADQAYRLAYWKMASEEINYRRFFDINELVGLRVEDPKVFEDRHRLIAELVQKEDVAGLRVDHVDGLYDPAGYLKRLQRLVAGSGKDRARSVPSVIVEKVLGRDERLPSDWPIAGTTGYDFLNVVNGLLVDAEGLRALDADYHRFTKSDVSFAEVCYRGNAQVMRQLFAGELSALAHSLGKLAAHDRHARDLPLSELVQALVEVTACLPVYRTYIRDFSVSSRDRAHLEHAFDVARRRTAAAVISDDAFHFLRRVLFLNPPAASAEGEREEWLRFVMQWQQFTGPVMAKGLEDTASYVYNCLISLNEVGGDSQREQPPLGVVGFHSFNQGRLSRWPHTLNASSTHDTKRSEDVRARINVLSELPEAWSARLRRWSRWNHSKKQVVNGRPVPGPDEEILLYQTMLGAWPFHQDQVAEFIERLLAFMQKALREAKVHTSWIDVDAPYESAASAFIRDITKAGESNPFFEDFLQFQKKIAFYGYLNSLAQTLLKITSPGIPDIYQGTELWNFSLVDPDNRRPVDFEGHARMQEELMFREATDLESLLRDLVEHWQDGRIKLYVIRRVLKFREANKELFSAGKYIPLFTRARKREDVLAFARRRRNTLAIIATPRLFTRIADKGETPMGRAAWGRGKLVLPEDFPREWRNVLTGEALSVDRRGGEKAFPMAKLFSRFPVALLEGKAK